MRVSTQGDCACGLRLPDADTGSRLQSAMGAAYGIGNHRSSAKDASWGPQTASTRKQLIGAGAHRGDGQLGNLWGSKGMGADAEPRLIGGDCEYSNDASLAGASASATT